MIQFPRLGMLQNEGILSYPKDNRLFSSKDKKRAVFSNKQTPKEQELVRFIYMDMYGKREKKNKKRFTATVIERIMEKKKEEEESYTHIKSRNMYSVERTRAEKEREE